PPGRLARRSGRPPAPRPRSPARPPEPGSGPQDHCGAEFGEGIDVRPAPTRRSTSPRSGLVIWRADVAPGRHRRAATPITCSGPPLSLFIFRGTATTEKHPDPSFSLSAGKLTSV